MRAFKVNRRIDTNMMPKKFFRPYGCGSHSCRLCGRVNGLVRRYGLFICRQCFREEANQLDFYR